MQTVVAPRVGVLSTESTANAATHGRRDRSTVKGVVVTESTSNAVTNSQSANE